MLAQRGAHIHATARNAERLNSLVGELRGGGHYCRPADVTDAEAMKRCFSEVLSVSPECNIVVFNAGTYTPMPIDEWDMETCKHTMQVNFEGMLHTLDAVLPHLKQQRAGHLVIVSSVAAYRGLPKSMAYGASKAALTNLTESLRIELAPYNITVQLVSPGFVKTRLTEKNNFSMPMAISADKAAEHIADGMQRGNYDIHFPKKFSWFMKLIRVLPNPVYFWLARYL